ncbi:MAG TPA: diguanylate cyclase, partial [Thermoanaerobaculia bacterium]|nr:diguanylate cyclase [Thermoanaerobaculia bacterium]
MQAPELLRLLSEKTRDVFWSADASGVLTYVAPQIRGLTGRNPAELIGIALRTCVHDQDAPESASLERLLLERRDECSLAYRLTRAEGEPVWVEATMHAVRSADGEVTGFIGTWHDITDTRRVEVAYEHQAYHDTLTGLANRRLFEDRLTIALAHARRHGSQLALLYIDVDRLARINDTLGHRVGDEVLRGVAQRLASTVRASDTLARLGADDFVMLVNNLRHAEDSVRVAQLLLNKLRDPLVVGDKELFATASIGVAVFPQDGTEVSSILASADAASRTCKKLGGNGWYLHNSAINKRGIERLAVEVDLYRAIERSQFIVHYQPLLGLNGKHLTAVEALVRWKHPTKGELPPAAFIDVAEETGLIIGIGERVMES